MRPSFRLAAGLALCLAGGAPALAIDHAALAARALDEHVLPGFDALAMETAALASAAADCSDGTLDAYQRAFDAWMGVSHLRFGPLEEGETGFAIAFWPDQRGLTPRTLAALAASEDPAVDDPAAFAQVSVAGRGLFALDALLGEGSPPLEGYGCRLAGAVARDLAATSALARDRWRDPYAGYMRTAGASGNPLYLAPEEPTRALFTAMLTGLEATADLRLGRPLGDFMKPQPRRAEAWRTGRPARNVALSVAAVEELYRAAFAAELPEAAQGRLDAALAETRRAVADAGVIEVEVESVGGRLRVEAAQQAVRGLRAALEAEIGPPLGVAGGFNSMDGD
jgi:predicted lipoprotein